MSRLVIRRVSPTIIPSTLRLQTNGYHSRIYNAVRLTLRSLETAHKTVYFGGDNARTALGVSGRDSNYITGRMINLAARNISFACLHGTCSTDDKAELKFTFRYVRSVQILINIHHSKLPTVKTIQQP